MCISASSTRKGFPCRHRGGSEPPRFTFSAFPTQVPLSFFFFCSFSFCFEEPWVLLGEWGSLLVTSVVAPPAASLPGTVPQWRLAPCLRRGCATAQGVIVGF